MKKGVKKLSSTRNKKLARQMRQEIYRAVNELYRDHPAAQFTYEQVNVTGMRYKARRMNAYLYAASLAHNLAHNLAHKVAHIPAQFAWGAAKRGMCARQF